MSAAQDSPAGAAVVALVAAMDQGRLIGRGGRLPWHLPADLRHFKRLTLGKPIVMGRRTWESLGRPLPGRENIVVSTTLGADEPGCVVVRSLDQALAAGSRHPEVMVIGGAALYAQSLPLAARMYLTLVDGRFEGDTFFPRYDPEAWRETAAEARPADGENPHPCRFVTLERVRPPSPP